MVLLYFSGMLFLFVFGMYALYLYNKKVLSDKYIKESKKLQLMINNLRYEYGDLLKEPSDFIGSTISNLGIEALLDQLGINPSILQHPIVKGFLDKYLKKGAENVPSKQQEKISQV